MRRAKLKAYREEFYAAQRQLTAFIDDATALLLCESSHSDRKGVKTQLFAQAYRKKRHLDGILNDPELTLGAILDKLISVAREVSEEIRAA